MNQKHYDAALSNVENHLGDVIDPESMDDGDLIAEETFTLAYDGARAAGAQPDEARVIALSIAQG